jgi:hypothetical protein
VNLWLYLKSVKWIRLTRYNHWNLNEIDIFCWSRMSGLWPSWINRMGWSGHCHLSPYESFLSHVFFGFFDFQ